MFMSVDSKFMHAFEAIIHITVFCHLAMLFIKIKIISKFCEPQKKRWTSVPFKAKVIKLVKMRIRFSAFKYLSLARCIAW